MGKGKGRGKGKEGRARGKNGGGEAEQGGGKFEQGGGTAEQGRGKAEQGGGTAEQGRGKAEQGGGTAEQGRGKAEQGGGKCKQARGKGEQICGKGKQVGGGHQKAGSREPEGDSYSQATRAAKFRAAANLRAARQNTFSDIPKYNFRIYKGKDKWKLRQEVLRLFKQRAGRFSVVESTDCENIAVTPPHHSKSDDKSDDANIGADEVTYHIVVFENGNDKLEALVREYDGYVVAFRRQPKDKDQNWGWFYFWDVELPVRLFGGAEQNWKLKYSSGYMEQHNVEVGEGCFEKIVEVLLGFNAENYKVKKYCRERMIETLKVFLGECQRLSAILRFFLINIDSLPWVPLGNILSFWTTHWANLGDGIINLVLAFIVKSLHVEEEVTENEDELRLAKTKEALHVRESKKEIIEKEANLRLDKAKTSLKRFMEENGIPVTREQFLNKTQEEFLKWIDRVVVDGKIPKESVSGADQEDQLSRPILNLLDTIPESLKWIDRVVVDGKIPKESVLGADQEDDQLSLPIINLLDTVPELLKWIERVVVDGKIPKELVSGADQQYQLTLYILKLLDKVPEFLKWIDRVLVDGKIPKESVSAADQEEYQLSLRILVSYITLFKYESNLVPHLILRQNEYKGALEVL